VNNQLGFTPDTRDSYSTSYASGLGARVQDPDRPRQRGRSRSVRRSGPPGVRLSRRVPRDFLIDLFGYRRWGHNEGDEPAFTQPVMYQKIANHPTVREIWARTLVDRRRDRRVVPDALNKKYLDALQRRARQSCSPRRISSNAAEAPPPGAAAKAQTGVPAGAADRVERRPPGNAARLCGPPQARTAAGEARRRARASGRAHRGLATARSWRWPRSSPMASASG